MKLVFENTFHWYIGKRESYDSLEEIDNSGLYFLYNTKEILFRNQPFTYSIILYNDGERPLEGIRGKIYLNTSNMEGWIFNDGQWIKLLAPVQDAISLDGSQNDGKASGILVQKYISKEISNIKANTITDLKYDNENKVLVYTKNNVDIEIPLSMGDSLEFDEDERLLHLVNGIGEVVSSVEIFDNHIVNGTYDNDRKALIFEMSNGSEVYIASWELLHLYNGLESETTTVQIVQDYIDAKNVIKTEVKIASKSAFQIKEDGLYFNDKNSKNCVTKVDPNKDGEVLIVTEDGNLKTSGYKIGRESFSESLSNTLATEMLIKLVENAVLLGLGTMYLPYKKIKTVEDLNFENPGIDYAIPISVFVDIVGNE